MRPIFTSAPITLLHLTSAVASRYATTIHMRLLFTTTIVAITLFFSGCLHVPAQPPTQPPNGNNLDTLTTTPLPTATLDISGWNTYVNYTYGFSFRYPKEWGYTTNSYHKSVTFVSIGQGEKQERMRVAIQDFVKATDENTEFGIEWGGEYPKNYLKRLKIDIKDNPKSKSINGLTVSGGVGRYPDSGDIVKTADFFIRDNYILFTFLVDIPLNEYIKMSIEDQKNKAKSLDRGEFFSQLERDQFRLFDTIINTIKPFTVG